MFKVGSAVTSLTGNMGNFMRSPAFLVSKVPPRKTVIGAASMPVAYLTALYALRYLVRLTQGESVLIQSATGGLGMAALRVAQFLRAKIYATVGNDEKRKILIDKFGIPAEHVFKSREMSAVDGIMQVTGGAGVDVIFSSSGGDLMHETWQCIAPLGQFITVGRTDILGGGRMELDMFKKNAVFASFDLGVIYRQKTALFEKYQPPYLVPTSELNPSAPVKAAGSKFRLMNELNQLRSVGTIGPIELIVTFDISQLESTMTSSSKGLHTGKSVVTFNNPKAILKSVNR